MKKLAQQPPQNAWLLPKPLGPSDVTLARTPGVGLALPPKPKEVTDAGTPFTCAAETAARAKANRTKSCKQERTWASMRSLPRIGDKTAPYLLELATTPKVA